MIKPESSSPSLADILDPKIQTQIFDESFRKYQNNQISHDELLLDFPPEAHDVYDHLIYLYNQLLVKPKLQRD